MRVTVDLDSRNQIKCLWSIFKAYVLLRKKPDKIHITKKGYHLVYRNVSKNNKEVLRIRKWLGDDKNRIKLDSQMIKKPQQVLFSEKRVVYYNPNYTIRHDSTYYRDSEPLPWILKKLSK
jgi:hypothetical protein